MIMLKIHLSVEEVYLFFYKDKTINGPGFIKTV